MSTPTPTLTLPEVIRTSTPTLSQTTAPTVQVALTSGGTNNGIVFGVATPLAVLFAALVFILWMSCLSCKNRATNTIDSSGDNPDSSEECQSSRERIMPDEEVARMTKRILRLTRNDDQGKQCDEMGVEETQSTEDVVEDTFTQKANEEDGYPRNQGDGPIQGL